MKSPYLMINMAMSVDGKVSSAPKEPTTFTSREDKRLLVEIRSECDAMIVAAGTVKMDKATLTVPDERLREIRVKRGQKPHPVRIVVSGSLSLSPSLPIFKKPVSPLLIVCCEKAAKKRQHQFAR